MAGRSGGDVDLGAESNRGVPAHDGAQTTSHQRRRATTREKPEVSGRRCSSPRQGPTFSLLLSSPSVFPTGLSRTLAYFTRTHISDSLGLCLLTLKVHEWPHPYSFVTSGQNGTPGADTPSSSVRLWFEARSPALELVSLHSRPMLPSITSSGARKRSIIKLVCVSCVVVRESC